MVIVVGVVLVFLGPCFCATQTNTFGHILIIHQGRTVFVLLQLFKHRQHNMCQCMIHAPGIIMINLHVLNFRMHKVQKLLCSHTQWVKTIAPAVDHWLVVVNLTPEEYLLQDGIRAEPVAAITRYKYFHVSTPKCCLIHLPQGIPLQ